MTTENQSEEKPSSVWATVTELSETYNISVSTVRRWIRRYDTVRYISESNMIRIHREDFNALVNSFVRTGESSPEGE